MSCELAGTALFIETKLDPTTLFDDLEETTPVLVAVSGGSDSIALLMLAHLWAKQNNVHLYAATVDHGLRPEAAEEAAFVASVCTKLGVTHRTLKWEGQKPSSGLSAAAREARYELLETYAQELGAKSMLLGHQANDQAETVLMRIARETGAGLGRGLSGIPRISTLPKGTGVYRPLLAVSRDVIRSFLQSHGQSWVEDPSNADEAYERVRVRNNIGDDPQLLSDCARFAGLMGRKRKILVGRAVEFLKTNLSVDQGPVYRLATANVSLLETQILEFVLSICVTLAGGARYLPNCGDLAASLLAGDRRTQTQGGAAITLGSNCVYFYRENRNIKPKKVAAGEALVWDNRFLIQNKSKCDCHCDKVAEIELEQLKHKGKVIKTMPHPALATCLSISFANGDFYLPHLMKNNDDFDVSVTPITPAIEHFCPEYDFELLTYLRALKGHNCFANSAPFATV